MYLVQTVSNNSRPWASYNNIPEVTSPRMNRTDDISNYNSNNSHYYSPVLARRHGGLSYDVQKSPKKDKKWSFGNLFRLKKKNGSDSSTEEETEHKIFLQKKKKKSIKRKQSNKATGFDHVVIPPSSRYNNHFNEYKKCEDPSSILSEPTYSNSQIQSKNYFPASTFTKKAIPLNDSREHVERNYINRSISNTSFPSANTLGKFKKEYVKARAEARRDTSNGGDSSGEESQKSAFKSDESLCANKDGVLRKKSRAARTQRYLKRISKDDDNGDYHNNVNVKTCNPDLENSKITAKNEALPKKFINKSYSENFSSGRTQLCYTNSAPSRTNLSGISTIPPKHDFQNKYRTISSTNSSLYKQNNNIPQEYNDINKQNLLDLNNHRSLSCEANIHTSQNEVGVINGCLPLRKPSNKRMNGIINSLYGNDKIQSPPPPPPRDPKRVLYVQNSDVRPISYSFDNGHLSKVHYDRKTCKSQIMSDSRQNLLNPNNRSTSEDHIFLNPMQRIPLLPRPSSTTPETNRLQKLHQSYCDAEKANDYRYLTDKNPRSRKPICIRSSNTNLSPNQNSNSTVTKTDNKSQNTFDFWKQKEEESTRIHNNNNKLPSDSNRMFTAYTHVRNNVFLPNGNKMETHSAITNENNDVVNNLNATSNKTNPLLLQNNKVDPVLNDSVDSSDRKSSNLEDALDELEAIYNSLHLGDEDLLDRAEQRELDAVQKQRDSTFESYPSSFSKGTLSDSCYGYDQNLESTRRKRFLKRIETDRSTDDMAFRKLNKNRHNTVGDQQSSVAKISYLLASPIFGATPDEDKSLQNKANSKEPDITFDDVVYRNVKHSNNTLKVVDPQPPFGIPVGPISLASPSDYLHVSLEESKQPTNEPDVIKDDLAYRNLRKDSSKKPSPTNQNLSVVDDFINNNNFQVGETFKKKRAVRSLSANIYNLMHKEVNFDKPIKSDAAFNENISDIADALEIAREILRKKENKITSVRKAYMSDDELKKRKLTELSLNSPALKGENSYQNKVRVNIPILNSDSCDITYKVRESTPTVKDGDLTNELCKESALDELITSLSLGAFNNSERSSDETDKSVKLEHIIKELKSEEACQDSNREIKSGQCNQERVLPEDEMQDLDDTRSSSLSQLLSEIDSFAEQSAAGEDMLNSVSNSSPYLVATRVESEPFEQVSGIQIEPVVYETVANVILTPSNDLDENVITTEVFSDSEHDYANIVQSNEDVQNCIDNEEKCELSDGATFLKNEDDLSDEISNDIKMLSSFLEGSTDARSQECCSSGDISHNTLKLSPFFQISTSGVSEEQQLTDVSLEDRDDKNEGEKNSEMLCDASSAAMCVLTNQVCFNINNPSSSYSYDSLNYDNPTKGNEKGSINIEEMYLESLKAPKLVQNLSFLSNPVKSNFCDDETVKVGSKKTYNENVDDESYLCKNLNFFDSTLENLEQNVILNNTDCNSINIPIVPESHNSIQSNTCDTKEINESRISKSVCTFSKSNLNLVNVDNNVEQNNNQELRQSQSSNAKIGLVSQNEYKSFQDDIQNDFCSKNKLHNEACSSGDNMLNATRNSSCLQESQGSPESNSNYSWYEDPSVIALACSCGIACTSQLPSFDIIFMLGLLFAIISLLLALISRFVIID